MIDNFMDGGQSFSFARIVEEIRELRAKKIKFDLQT